MLRELAELVRRLQATPPFPLLGDFFDGVDQLLARLITLDLLEPSAMEPHLQRYGLVRDACRRRAPASVSSHNDLNPRNVLYDGQRLWLVDWEAAFRNDP